MKVLVTVGSGSFDELIRFCDKYLSTSDYSLTYQIGQGKYIPSAGDYFRYAHNLDDSYNHYDIIITHCGAGTVYKCLDLGIEFIAVPNTFRKDKHQLDLGNYLNKNNYARVCFDLNKLDTIVQDYLSFRKSEYEFTSFYGAKYILNFIDNK